MKLLKTSFLIGIFCGLASWSNAQKNEKTLSPEVYLNVPTGNASLIEGIGFSINGQLQIPIQKSGFNFLARTGVDIFGKKTYDVIPVQYVTLDAIPVVVGVRYYFTEGFHGDLEMGTRIKLSSGFNPVFDLAPSIGYATKRFDPFIRYSTSLQSFSSFVSFGARYQFKVR